MKDKRFLKFLGLILLVACAGGPPPPTLEAPRDFSAVAGSGTSIGLSWLKVAQANAYELERQVGEGSFTPLITLPHEVGGPFGQIHTDTGLSPGTRYTYRIRAVNDRIRSEWVVAGPVETPTAGARYRIQGFWLGASNPNLYLSTDQGVNFSGATVTVNGTSLPYRNPPGSYYAPSIPGAGPGTRLELSIEVPEGRIEGAAAIPEAASLTAPTPGASLPAGQPLTVTWSHPGPDPDRFYLQLLGSGSLNYVANNIPGSERSHTISGEQLNASSNAVVFIYLYAVNDGQSSLTGPVLPTSRMGVASRTSVEFQIVP